MLEDFTTTNNPKYLHLADLRHPFPEWVKQCEIPSKADFEKKSSAAFADPHRRLLPISTKAAAWYSAINLFSDLSDYGPEVFDRVKEACAHFGIEEEIQPHASMFAEDHEKSASVPAGKFAIDTEIGGVQFQLLPLNGAEDVRDAAAELGKMASENRIHFLTFVPAAREICKSAAEHGVESLPSLVWRFGIERLPDKDRAAELIAGRENLCKDAEASPPEFLAEGYAEALELVGSDPELAMAKIAAVDQAAGIQPSYKKLSMRAPTPFDIVFGGEPVERIVKAADENVLCRGVLVPLEEVKKINETPARYRMGKQAAEDLLNFRDGADAKNLSLATHNWPEEDQKTFLRLALEVSQP